MIGVEYTRISGPGGRISSDLPCLIQGGGPIIKDGVDVFRESLGWAFANCQSRYTILLERKIDTIKADNNTVLTKWRILDAVILPPTSYMDLDTSADPLHVYQDGDCLLDGKTGTALFATLRWGDRGEDDYDPVSGIEWADWQTGIEQAWAFDLDALRIVPVSTKRVKCGKQWYDEDED